MFAVGYVHRPHGLNGEVSVERIADAGNPFEAGEGLVWILGDRRRDLKVSSSRPHAGRWLVSFEGIGDVEAARDLSGGALCVEAEGLPEAGPDFWWSHELEGWTCEDGGGAKLGTVKQLEETPAGPRLTLETPEGREVLVPFVRPIVVEIDRGGRRIVLDPPVGLMEL
ncbi:MAG TPA: ribosome maturation factor RimM [Thermoanaerobaculia bacterium]|nr:ribosome maturation factor RimM [Thermoanaerobaculia bacterium]